MLAGAGKVQCIDRADQRHDGEDGREDDAELVGLRNQNVLAEELRLAITAGLYRRDGDDRQYRDQHEIGFTHRSR